MKTCVRSVSSCIFCSKFVTRCIKKLNTPLRELLSKPSTEPVFNPIPSRCPVFFKPAFVGSHLCLPYSISVISFIINWILGHGKPAAGVFVIIFPLINAGTSGVHRWLSNGICQCEVTKTNYG